MTQDWQHGSAAEGREQSAKVAYLGAAHWQQLLNAPLDGDVLSSWLALQCSQIDRIKRAVLVSRRNGPFRPVAFWPEAGATSRFLMEAVNEALTKRIDLIRNRDDEPDVFGIVRLVRRDARVIAVIAVEVAERNEVKRQEILRQLQWGSAWVEVLERRRLGEADRHAVERLTLALDIIAVAGEHKEFRAAATAALTSLSVQLGAARISFGIRGLRGCRVMAVSNTTSFDRRVESVRAISEAMDEAVDQLTAIAVPPDADVDEVVVRRKATALASDANSEHVTVQPYARDGKPAGAIVFEWAKNETPPAHICAALSDITALLGPILHDKCREERWLLTKGLLILRRELVRILGPRYFARKAIIATLALLTLFFATYKTNFRITADARLRGAVERVIVAPLDGYITEAPVRAGDSVERGALLVKFEDVEYQLERYSWQARELQFETELAKALAEFDRAGINILRARIEEARAQIELNETRIALTQVRAPFEAVVISGDLSQSLGQSVQRGTELFRIAPLESYLVEIEVPENDVLYLEPGATGNLVLASLPSSVLPIELKKITPVTQAREGENRFLVEASLNNPNGVPVSPGMEGIAKIEAGEVRLIWIWTRRVMHWLRMTWWRWAP